MGGGGSYNPNTVSCLRDQLPHTRFALIDEIGIPEETLGFSLLGLEGFVGRLMIVPKNVESDKTGVIRHIQPGKKHAQDTEACLQSETEAVSEAQKLFLIT
jgi:hypothetical protein